MDSYEIFIDAWVSAVKKLESIKEILTIYLSGSVARGDYKIGFSDIDIYVVTKYNNRSFSDIQTVTENLTHCYLPEMTNWYPDCVTIAYESHENIINGKTWLGMGSYYFSFIESAKLLYGENIKGLLKKPEDFDIQKTSKDILTQLSEVFKQDFSIPKDKSSYRGLIGNFFTGLHFFLALNGVFARDKFAMLSNLAENYPEYKEIADFMRKLWESDDFLDISDEKFDCLLEKVKDFSISIGKRTL